ncbi:glycosyltransferase [Kordiimonas sp.]|uniref:glycosyltransferase n=1 Tax=Kordiimonas sp. TaxID=1970157 RepID=UPI003A8F3AB7
MVPEVYNLGASIALVADKAARGKLSLDIEGTAGTNLQQANPGQVLAGLNLIEDGDFSSPRMLWQTSEGTTAGVNLSPTHKLENASVAYVQVAEDTPTASLIYIDPVQGEHLPVLPGYDYIFSAHMGAEGCDATLRVEFLRSDCSLIEAVTGGRAQLPTGGTHKDGYELNALRATAPAGARFARLSIEAELQAPAVEGRLFFTFMRFYIGAGQPTRGWTAPPCDMLALLKAVQGPSAVLFTPAVWERHQPGDKQVTLKIDGQASGEPQVVYSRPLVADKLEVNSRRLVLTLRHTENKNIAAYMGDVKRPSAIGLQVAVDGVLQTTVFAQKVDNNKIRRAFIKLDEACFDGELHQVRITTFEGQVLVDDMMTLAAHGVDYERLRRLSNPPFKTQLSPLAGLRYRSLEAQMKQAGELGAEGVAQVAWCHDAIARGFEKNREFRPLKFPVHARPMASVIIPAHNKFAVTYNCLAALLFAFSKASFEVVLVDDGSTDATADIEGLVSGIRVVRHEAAKGFVHACNAGAAVASGAHLVFLNNDTEVTYGWLDELLFAFEHFVDVGLVGAKLIYPGGELQEAGGIIWSDANGWNYGRMGNAQQPRYNYTRPVHYCSGAAIMVSRTAWDEVGGFSDAFAPAYYEDTDIAFALRAKGYKTLYAPLSTVVHFEGISNGKEVKSSGLKRFQAINQPKFLERHREALARGPKPGDNPDLAKDEGVTKRALFIDYQFPCTDIDAGSYAAIQEIRLMQSLGYKVTFIPSNMEWMGRYTDQLQRIGVEAIYAPFYASVDEFVEERGAEFDVVYITRYDIAELYLPGVRAHAAGARVLFNNADLHFLREERAALVSGDKKALKKAHQTREAELSVCHAVDLCLSYNDVEQALLVEHGVAADKIAQAPWVVDTSFDTPAFEGREGIAFLGGYRHPPNVEAVEYFVKEVMPDLRDRMPGVTLYIYGSNVSEAVLALDADDVKILGFVEDVAEVYDRHRLFIAPLLSGAGIKGKVLAAFAHGIPTILSPVAVEGTGANHGADCLVADGADEWVQAISSLYNDEAQWHSISECGKALIEKNYSFESARLHMLAALKRVGAAYEDEPSGLFIGTSTMNLEP